MYDLWIIAVFKCKLFRVYLKYTGNSSTWAQSNILQLDLSTTSPQLKGIKYKISCSNFAEFKYTSLVYQKYNCRVFLINT